MRIAVVTPKVANGGRGGAENLYEGLVQALNDAGHEATQVNVLVDESSFDKILEAYCRCYYLNLDDYDLVISTKAPTYMVRHRNHISYLLHTIRVFYDMFDREMDTHNSKILKQRKIIFEMDKYGLSPKRIKKHFVNGTTVFRRMEDVDPYWKNIHFEALHHPPKLEGFKQPQDGEYILFPGRLHRWKRPELIIAAMKYINHDVKLLIAGNGEDEEHCKELAKGDSRIQFLGRVDNEKLIDLYSRAIVVPFIPINEDYGLITVEAFESKKPVITCKDSGEPANIVKDGTSGFIVDPDPRKIAEKISYLIEHPSDARKMGEAGFESVRGITWDSVVSKLLGSVEANSNRIGPEIKVLVTDMQPIEPAIGGGRLRLKGLYSNFLPNFTVKYVGSYDWPGEKYREMKISDNLTEVDVPFSNEHFKINDHINKLVPNNVTIDVLSPFLAFSSENFVDRVRKEANSSDVIIVSHPWLYTTVSNEIGDKYLVYDSHNYEYDLRRQLFPQSGFGKCIVEYVRFVEEALCQRANLILACSDEDKQNFIKQYHISDDKILVIPNGTFVENFNSSIDKKTLKKKLNISGFSAVFVGSDYPPNRDAASFIINDLAKKMPDVKFIILGGVSVAFKKSRVPSNVLLAGTVSQDALTEYMLSSDLALNPMLRGSGVNIKMLDYFAAGLPVITTSVGARGLDNNGQYIVCDLSEFAANIRLLKADIKLLNDASSISALIAKEKYDWRSISLSLSKKIETLYRESK